MPRCRATIAAAAMGLLLAACSSTSSAPAPDPAPTTAGPTPSITVAPAAEVLVPFTFEMGASGLRFERPASWRVLDVVQPTMASIAMLTNGPSHDPCTTDGAGGQTCSTPVDTVADGQIVVMIATSVGSADGAEPVSEQLESLAGVDAVVSGRPVRIDRNAVVGCVAGADHGIAVSAPAELPAERVMARFCWRGDTYGAIARAVDAALSSMTLAPMTTGVAVPSPDHWPVVGSGPGWELRAHPIGAEFACLDLTLDGRTQGRACFRIASSATKQMAVQVGLMQAIDGKRFAYGVILGDDTPVVLDHDPPITVSSLPVATGVRAFVTQVDTWATGTCDAFALMDTLEATRPGERPTVLPPLCRGDEADLYLLTASATNESGRVVTFRRNADRTWRVAFDPWGVQTG